jgi:protein-disulfide isomerase
VYQSRFGTVWGIPVSIFSGIWFVGAALLSIGALAGRGDVRESIPGYLFAMSTVALAAVLYLLYVSVFVLHVYCPMCLLIDAAVIGLFLVSGAATSVPMTTLPRRAIRDLRALVASPLAITVTVLFFTGAVSTLAFFPREASTEVAGEPAATPVATAAQQSELERFMATATRVPLIVPREGAKVLIVKFNDFQCPACSHSYLTYKPILAKYEARYPGAVKVVLKDFPLNTACNAASSVVHPSACDAAVAVRLARQHDRGEAMEEWFYTHQPAMTPPSVRQAAKDIGQVQDFDEKYAETIALIKADVALGNQLSIRSTPSFFINGVKVEGEWAPQYFDQAIAYELAHAPAQ